MLLARSRDWGSATASRVTSERFLLAVPIIEKEMIHPSSTLAALFGVMALAQHGCEHLTIDVGTVG